MLFLPNARNVCNKVFLVNHLLITAPLKVSSSPRLSFKNFKTNYFDNLALFTTCDIYTKHHGPTDSSKIVLGGPHSILDTTKVCPDMKKNEKHCVQAPKQDKKYNRQKYYQRKQKKQNRKCKQKHKKMASQTDIVPSIPSGSSQRSPDEDDDICIVFDKNKDRPLKEGVLERANESKFCLSKPFDMRPQDIPLPPENWVSHKRLTDSVRLNDIPLPPSPNTYDRLGTVNEGKVDSEVAELRKLLKSFRKWELTELGKTLVDKVSDGSVLNPLHPPNSFTVMSYNVLAQQLLEDHSYLYRRHDQKVLDWKYRSNTLWKEILEADADILCLQEVQASHLDSFYSRLKDLGYEGIFKRRSNQHADGCAIYYKTHKLKLLESTTVEYFQDHMQNSCILDRHNIAIIARLLLRDNANQVVVATTHLLYNPRRHDVRLAQTQVLLTELDRISFTGTDKISGKPQYLPIIVTGDFNLQPDTAVYKFIVEGHLNYSTLAAKSLTQPYYGQDCQNSLLPFELQISNTCQHLGLLLHRIQLENSRTKKQKEETSKFSKLYNSETYKSPQHYKQIQSGARLLYEEDFCGRVQRGHLSHCLGLQSVYKHQIQSPNSRKMNCEATTFQDDWVTVDYIFYSGIQNERNMRVEQGSLKLLSRYTLPHRGQCNQLQSIPNPVCGSDHLSLMAHFLLDHK